MEEVHRKSQGEKRRKMKETLLPFLPFKTDDTEEGEREGKKEKRLQPLWFLLNPCRVHRFVSRRG